MAQRARAFCLTLAILCTVALAACRSSDSAPLLICDAGPAQFGPILCSCDQIALAGVCADVSDATFCAEAADGGLSGANGQLFVVCNGSYSSTPCDTQNRVGSCYGSASVITRMYSRNFTTATAESACVQIQQEEDGLGGCFIPN